MVGATEVFGRGEVLLVVLAVGVGTVLDVGFEVGLEVGLEVAPYVGGVVPARTSASETVSTTRFMSVPI